MYIYIYICTCIYIYIYTHTHTCTYIYIYIHTYIHTHIHIQIQIHIHIAHDIHIHTYKCIYIYIYDARFEQSLKVGMLNSRELAVFASPPSSVPDIGERREPCRGGQTTRKANTYLGGVWTSQPEQTKHTYIHIYIYIYICVYICIFKRSSGLLSLSRS